MTQTGVQRVSLFFAAAATFVATTWWAARQDPAAVGAQSTPVRAAASAAGIPVVTRGSASAESGAPSGPDRDESAAIAEAGFTAYVSGKYAVLFREPTQSAHERARVLEALLARERVAVALNTARQGGHEGSRAEIPAQETELARLDGRLADLLRPADFAAFEVLRDSDMEQFQLDDYAGGIRNVAPLSESDRQTILYAKLVHRQRFRRVLDESGLMRGGLGPAERRHAFDAVSRALGDAQRDFLAEARQYLYDEQQYALLRNYENGEYAAELAKLRELAYRVPD